MHDNLIFLLALAAGGVLGVIFFGGLWWTVRMGLGSRRPALWFIGSLLLRMSIALAGFYFVGQGHAMRLIACLLGFVIARLAVTRLTHSSLGPQNRAIQEARHAP